MKPLNNTSTDLHSDNNTSLSSSVWKKQWYRFFIDADLLSKENGYQAYDIREPGAIESGKQAMLQVIDLIENPKPNQSTILVNEETICSIHRTVKAHQENSGIYRKHPTGLFLSHKSR